MKNKFSSIQQKVAQSISRLCFQLCIAFVLDYRFDDNDDMMIWFYLHKIAALRPNYNVQYIRQEKKKHTVWPETKQKVQQKTTEKQGQTVKQASKEENRKQEVQLWEFAVE